MTDRRSFLLQAAALWQAAATLSAQHVHLASAKKMAPYRFQFFNESERTTLQKVASRIVPADERSGGASAARVDEYIDFILAHADARLQAVWRTGLKNYTEALQPPSDAAIDAFLTTQSVKEFAPQSDNEVFFVLLKSAVVEGFYTSEEGINKELGYQGMGFVLDWQGCTHDSHAAPAGWQPSLKTRAGGPL